MGNTKIGNSAKKEHNEHLIREGFYNAMSAGDASQEAKKAFARKPYYLEVSKTVSYK